MTNLADQSARDRIKNSVDESLFVEAGAGAGKTSSLVGRLLTLILDRGVPMNQIAAITFTKKAAAELSERLAAALAENADNPRAQAALLELPSAAIETLHSFCQRLLQLYPLEAGIPPEIEIQDSFAEAKQTLRLHDRINDALTAAMEGTLDIATLSGGKVLDDDLQHALTHFASANGSMASLFELAAYMDSNWGELQPTLKATLPEEFVFGPDHAGKIVSDLEAIKEQCSDPTDKFAVNLANQIDMLRNRIGSTDFSPVSNFSRGSGGTKKNWGTDAKLIKDQCETIYNRWNLSLDKQAERPRAVLRYVLALLVLDHARARHRSGKLQFNDLVYLADEMLKTNEHVRADAHTRFTHVFVDEFQDTDPAQFRIVTAITTDPAAGDITPGALFTVGDPKQSIYRFRHADLDTYLKARAANEAGLVELTTNFRSTPKVLDWCNKVFAEYFPEAYQPPKKGEEVPADLRPLDVDFTALAPCPQDADPGSRTLVLDYQASKEENISRDTAESQAIAGIISQAIQQGWQRRVWDSERKVSVLKQLDLSDIAILVRTHVQAANLMAHLESVGIPYIAEGSALTYLAEEVEEFHTVIHAAADPSEPLAVGAALRTSLLGISDKELAAWAAAKQPLNIHYPEFNNVEGRIPDALNVLLELHNKSKYMDVGSFISWAIDELAIPQLVAQRSPFKLEALRRLEFVKQNARDFTAATHGTLREYSVWTDQLANERHQLQDPEATSANGVRILTLHASKGREFPMVILAGMYARKNNNPPVMGLHPTDGILEYKVGDLKSPRSEDIKLNNKVADAQETARLFYVAATRAKDHLIVCRRTDEKGSHQLTKGLNDAIDAAGVGHPISIADLPEFDPAWAPNEVTVFSDYTLADLEASTAAWVNARHPRQAATAIAHAEDRELELDPAWEVGFTQREHHGTEQGTALHWVMEHAGQGTSLQDLVSKAGVPAAAQAELLKMAETLVSSAIVTRAFACEHHRELPVFGAVGDDVVDGVIDLLYLDGNKWVIADYKTDISCSAQTAAEYFEQLGLYAKVIGDTLQAPVTRLELLFPRDKEVKVLTKTLN